jgi:hypothetical protein
MKSIDGIISVLATLAIVALATTLVLPGRQTGTVVRETFGGLSKLTSASLGK